MDASIKNWNSLQTTITAYKLEDDNLEDINPPAKNFRHATNNSSLHHLLLDMFGRMRPKDAEKGFNAEIEFIWMAMDQMSLHWDTTCISANPMKGWLMGYIYCPIFGIFQRIEGTEFHVGKTQPSHGDPAVRHDAILTHSSYKLDLLIVEGNRNTNYKARKEDLEKLEKALYRSLVQIIQELPEMSSDQLDALRVYGIIFSGLKVEFLEARCIKGIVVVYSVYTGAVPDNIISVYGFADLLEMTVAFKRRIEKTIRHIMDLKVPPQ
ncbi:hypothetical protein BGZ54_004993 [Gamsiella multidivaricata]|nr:hypothetical protein BGZ54_004993 [Gamsiella multidivaricata]